MMQSLRQLALASLLMLPTLANGDLIMIFVPQGDDTTPVAGQASAETQQRVLEIMGEAYDEAMASDISLTGGSMMSLSSSSLSISPSLSTQTTVYQWTPGARRLGGKAQQQATAPDQSGRKLSQCDSYPGMCHIDCWDGLTVQQQEDCCELHATMPSYFYCGSIGCGSTCPEERRLLSITSQAQITSIKELATSKINDFVTELCGSGHDDCGAMGGGGLLDALIIGH